MRLRLGLTFIALILGVVALPATSAAQTNTAEIAGTIHDSQGGVLPGVAVVAVNGANGVRVERISDQQGRYRLPDLPVGTYEVTATLSGFTRIIRTGVTLQLGQQVAIDLTLHVGGVSEEVTVTAATPLLQAANAEISDVIDHRAVTEIPLNGRNFLGLAQLSDAVVIPPGGTRGGALQQAGPLPNVGGQRAGHNIYLLDGVKVTDELFNNLVINPSVESIQEFKIQKSQYAAEFGGKASALINVATRAGSNTVHGSAFEFTRHDALDSRGFFDPADQPKPLLRQNQFGGTVGGPLKENRTFYFGSYEGQRFRRGLTRTFSVPSVAARAGNLGAVQIDPSAIDPIAAALLQQVPLPNRPGDVQNLVAVETQEKTTHQVSVRVDHRLTMADQLFARFSTFDADEDQPFGTSTLQETLLPGFGRRVDTHARNLGVSYTRVVTPSVLNEARFGWMRVDGGQENANQGVTFAAATGLQGVTLDPRNAGYPQISTRGLYATFGDPASTVVRDNQHVELYDNVLIDRGRHRIKFGGYLYHLQFRPEQPDNARGVFTYSGQFTGNAFGDFLIGAPASAVSGIGSGAEDGRTTWAHAFAQDDWRVRDNLTLNLGLRYEFNQHMHDVDNRLSSVDLAGRRFVIASDDNGDISDDAAALAALLPLPAVPSAEAGWTRGLLQPSSVRLAPRTGFALSLDDGRAVVRGGYGIFLNQWSYSVQTAFARNLPFFFTRQVDVPLTTTTPPYATRDILTADATGLVSPSIMNYDYNVEYTQTWSGGLQYQLGASTMAEIGYMGSWTLGADNGTIHNVPEPGPRAIQARRPIPELGPVRAIRFDGKSIYHGLTLRAERRLTNDVAYTVSYTLSTSKDDASSPGATEAESNAPQDVRNIFSDTGEWAHSSFDHRHMLTASGTWQVPYRGTGSLARALLADWRVNGVFFAQSGSPFTVNLGVDRANVGAGPAQRPDQIGDANLPAGERRTDRWFDTGAFLLPAPFTFGSARRNSVVGPGYASLDLAIAKTWPLASQRSIEFRWEIFNALNRTNLDLPNRIFDTPNFGRIFSAKPPREMQVGVKVSF
jgi:hypothetical protein